MTKRSMKRCKRLADSQKVYIDKGEGAAAEKGDVITIDFKGTIDGEPFEGGKRAMVSTSRSAAARSCRASRIS